MTAFGESDKKRILDSMTPEDLTILKGAFAVYDKGGKAFTLKDRFYSENHLSLGILLIKINSI